MRRYLSVQRDILMEKLSEPVVPREREGVAAETDTLDVFHTAEQEETMRDFQERRGDLRWYHRVWVFLIEEQSWLFLLVLGVAGALTVLFLDFVMDALVKSRTLLADLIVQPALSLLVWCSVGVVLAVLSGASVHLVSAHAAGSGIPEMKTILSGMNMRHYLSFRCFFSKCVGLLCAMGSGLSVGKEGPYVHICSIIAHQLSHMKVFERISRNGALRLQMLGAACALGVATTFGAPLGGVLFSIEVTSTYYLIHHMWKGFFCAVCASLFVRLIGSMGLVSLFSTNFEPLPYTPVELLIYAAMGVGFGFLSVVFIRFVVWLSSLKRRFRVLSPEFRYLQIVIVSLVISLVSYPLVYLRNDMELLINDLFEPDAMKIITTNVWLHLLIMGLLKAMFTAGCILLAIPAGVYTPLFMIGAALGRLCGEVIAIIAPEDAVIRGGYAVVGAAAFAGGVTRSLSTSMIVFELTGQLHHMLPVTLGVLISCAIANIWTVSLYDTLLEIKELPFLPMYNVKAANKTALDVMRPLDATLSVNASVDDAVHLLDSTTRSSAIAVCTEDMQLVGTVSREYLIDRVRQYEQEFYKEKSARPVHAPLGHSSVVGEQMADDVMAERTAAFAETPFVVPKERIDHSVLQLVAQTPLSKVHFMFSLLSPKFAFITEAGKLVGLVTKEKLIEFIRAAPP